MKKVIITDDEVQIRKGLRMKINWESLGYEIVGEASNGLEALSLLEKYPVDIVITDVRMPVMDGIEFTKRCHSEYPKVKMIVLSGYSDFEYARSAMRAGVKNYLLKPIAPDELTNALEKIRLEMEKEFIQKKEADKIRQKVNKQLQEAQEQFLLQLAKEDSIEESGTKESIKQLNLEHFLHEDKKYQFISVEIRNSTKNPHKPKELWLPFRMLCREIAKEKGNTYSFYDPNYMNMLHFIKEIDSSIPNNGQRLVDEIAHYVNTYMNLEVVIGVGKEITGYSTFKSGYRSSILSWSHSEIGSHSQILDGNVNKEMFKFTLDIEKKLINAIENNKVENFSENVYSLLGSNQNHSIMSFSFISNRLLFLLDSLAAKYKAETKEIKQLMWKCQQSIWELNAQNKVIESLLTLGNMIIEFIKKERSSVGKDIVESVRSYLDQQYGEEISLTTLSEQFHINSAYLSELFKTHIGQNFSDYLLHLRMNKALQLLKENELKIIDIAQLVGFSNSGYFSTVFKKYYGQTPADFRKSAVGC